MSEQLDGATVISPDRMAGALNNMSLDQFELGPAQPAGQMVVLRVGFEQVQHHRVQSVGDPEPSTCQASVPTHAYDGL